MGVPLEVISPTFNHTPGKPALINSAFGLFLVLLGAPIYFFYRRRSSSDSAPR